MKYFRSMDDWHYDPCDYIMHFHENFEIVYMLSGKNIVDIGTLRSIIKFRKLHLVVVLCGRLVNL